MDLETERTVLENTFTSLQCKAKGTPEPSIDWVFNGTNLDKNDQVKVLPDGRVHIEGISRAYAGIYTCVATNSFGTSKAIVKLAVATPSLPITGRNHVFFALQEGAIFYIETFFPFLFIFLPIHLALVYLRFSIVQ